MRSAPHMRWRGWPAEVHNTRRCFPRPLPPGGSVIHGVALTSWRCLVAVGAVPFVFGFPAELSSPGERHLSAAMGCYWTNFATTGNPNTGNTGCVQSLALPAWPALGGKGDALMFTNATNGISVKSGLKAELCELFKLYP